MTKDKWDEQMVRINELKKSNIQKIRECFYNCEIWTKNELSKKTGLSLAGTTNVLMELLANNEIEFIGEANSTGGRKSKQYILNKDYYHIGIIILRRENKNYRIIIKSLDLLSNIVYEKELISSRGTIQELDLTIKQLLENDNNVSILSISIPGVCQDGHVDICDYEEFEDFALGKYIYSKYHLEVIIENDVNVACIGFSDSYPEVSHLSFIYQPAVKYVGIGMMIDRKLYNGFSHFAGELRYLPFYTHQQQDEMLKYSPKELLLKQIVTLICVMNPEVIGYHSDVFDTEMTLEDYSIFKKHYPVLVRVPDFNNVILKGLYSIGLKNLMKRGRKDE